MRKHLVFLLLMMAVLREVSAQEAAQPLTGSVTYVTSQNVYVKFPSTENMAVGDTLFMKKGDILAPVLTIKALSSLSAVCIPLNDAKVSISDEVVTRQKTKILTPETTVPPFPVVPPVTENLDTVPPKKTTIGRRKQVLTGRVSISSYSNFSSETDLSQRMRYTFSLNMENIGGSKLSAETYMSFVHSNDNWDEIKNDVFNGLKIYSFALNYEFNRMNRIWLGRRINPRISSMGAIDGLQYELKLKSFTIGLVGGFRPDWQNYGFNANLVQFGGYLGHDYSNKKGSMQTTLAFIDQLNTGVTDRRFLYFQHTNSLLGNLYFFGSVELDIYNKVFDQQDSVLKQDNKPSLTNLYLSVRYRPIRQLSLALSYSSRQNIIYYETFKNYVDRLLEETALNGFTFQVSYQPVKRLSVGFNAGYRDRKTDPKPTKNLYAYVTYTGIPVLDISTTGSYTYLETSYQTGNIYSLGFSKDLMKGKFYLGINYRYVNYKFIPSEVKLVQNMGEAYITWRIMKKLSCSMNYEGTFENGFTFNRVYINLTQRF
jgi:hypothetical protein